MKNEPASITLQPQNGTRHGKAIVMGASMAGLWTARALVDLFEEVWIFERDHLPAGPEFRPGAPQVRQFHGLLESGLQKMNAWFPGLYEELISAGAVPYDITGDIHLRAGQRWFPMFPSGHILLSCSRLLLESSIRRRLRQDSRVRFVEEVDVVGLQTDADRQRVTGIRVRTRGVSNNPETDSVHLADLIVDALGRRSPTPTWLVELGYPAPRAEEVDGFLGYVTRKYKRKPGTPMLLIIATPPHDPYGGLVFPEEDDTMVAMLGGYNKHYPPNDPDEFEAFTGRLGPEFQAALQGAEPLSPPYSYRGTSSCWHHYEQMERWPGRYVVLGDAFCGFNPIYGQGMSVAAMSAAALADCVRAGRGDLEGVARSTLRAISQITQGAWLLATSADLQWPGTQGGTTGDSPADRFGRWYVNKLLVASAFDKEVRLAFNAVNQLIKPASALFAPGIFLRVMNQTFLKNHR